MGRIEPKTVTLKNGKEVCIRTPLPEDASKLLKYLDLIFQADRFFMTTDEESKEWRTIEKQKNRAQDSLQNDNKLLLITESDSNIVSMSDIECGQRNRNQHVGQMGISILPKYRGNGLGTAIIQTMIDWAAAHPVIEKLALGVWAENTPAFALYEKMEFIEEGRKVREVKYADGTYDDMVGMYRFVE